MNTSSPGIPPVPPDPPPEVLDAGAYEAAVREMVAADRDIGGRRTRNPFWVEPWYDRCAQAETLARNLRFTLVQFVQARPDIFAPPQAQAQAQEPGAPAQEADIPSHPSLPAGYPANQITVISLSASTPLPAPHHHDSEPLPSPDSEPDADDDEGITAAADHTLPAKDGDGEGPESGGQSHTLPPPVRPPQRDAPRADPASARAWRKRYAGTPWASMADSEITFWRGLYRSAVLHVHPDRCAHADQTCAQAWFDAVHQNFLLARFDPLVGLAGHLWSKRLLGGPARSAEGRTYLRRHWRARLAAARRLIADIRAGPVMRMYFGPHVS